MSKEKITTIETTDIFKKEIENAIIKSTFEVYYTPIRKEAIKTSSQELIKIKNIIESIEVETDYGAQTKNQVLQGIKQTISGLGNDLKHFDITNENTLSFHEELVENKDNLQYFLDKEKVFRALGLFADIDVNLKELMNKYNFEV